MADGCRSIPRLFGCFEVEFAYVRCILICSIVLTSGPKKIFMIRDDINYMYVEFPELCVLLTEKMTHKNKRA